MAFGKIQLQPQARRSIGVYLSFLCLVQFVIGIVIIGYGSYFIEKLQWKISIISSYDSRTMNIITVILGSSISVFHLCGAKILYDSGKETTRFESFLLLLVIIFTCLLIMEFIAAITCKVHFSWFDEIFQNEKGFITAIKEYGENPNIRKLVDQLQIEDQCCGAENFSDWLNEDWVSPRFNPMFNPNLTPEQKSLYYPWQLNSLSDPMEQLESDNIPIPVPAVAPARPTDLPLSPWLEQYESPVALIPVNPHNYYGVNQDEFGRIDNTPPPDISK